MFQLQRHSILKTPAMYSPPAQLQESHLDAPNGFGSTLFNAAEELTSRNLAGPRVLAQDAAETARNLLGSDSTQKAVATARGLGQPAAEKRASYWRSIHGIGRRASAESAKIAQTVSPLVQSS